MSIEPVLNIAFAMQSNPGVYALLLGSGVSRAANIPTGWEIVLDLIRKVAALQGGEVGDDPEAWYCQMFGESPSYSKLMGMLAKTPAERQALLKPYFEPNEEERERGEKLPTKAHKAIARLIRDGSVRLILTTNFDRLTEMALEEEGITPDVIATKAELKGAMPLVHSRCCVVKLHGDYRDMQIQNTPDELSKYPPALNCFLNRVFDEFGIIICGWSGEWDAALRDALLRARNRRFTTYWLARDEPGDEAKRVIANRCAEEVTIASADEFFVTLEEKVDALRNLQRSHPLSVAAAAATVKRYVPEPVQRVRLHDLFHEETERVCREITSGRFVPGIAPTKETVANVLHGYEALMERLMAMLAALAYHDTGKYAYLLTRVAERLLAVASERRDGIIVWIGMQRYPALLATYTGGIAALAMERFDNLAAVLLKARFTDPRTSETKPVIWYLRQNDVFPTNERLIPRKNAEREWAPISNYLYFDILPRTLRDYLPDRMHYENTFDLLEYLWALTYWDVSGGHWAPLGRYAPRWKRLRDLGQEPPWLVFLEERGRNELLKAGLFSHSQDRLREVVRAHKEWVEQETRRWL